MQNKFQKTKSNLNVTTGERILSEEAIRASVCQQQILQSLQEKHFSIDLKVPTDDNIVKNRLRIFNVPIIIFGENKGKRRDRLKTLMAQMKAQGKSITFDDEKNDEELKKNEDDKIIKKNYYVEGHPMLRKARMDILKFSIQSANKRLKNHSKKLNLAVKQRKIDLFKSFNDYQSQRSEIGGKRPLCSISLSLNREKLVLGSWSGWVKIWNLKNNSKKDFCHGERLSDAQFFPEENNGKDSLEFVTLGFDGKIKLWNSNNNKPISTLSNSSDRLSKIAFLTTERKFAISSSFDKTWSLWDLETGKNLFKKTGHSDPVYAVAVHPDSSICATGDLGGITRLWDLRSGKALLNLRGHVGQILSADFSPNGYQLATGSGDNTVKIWDIRKKNLFYVIPAHFKDVSCVKFHKSDCLYLVTGSFDKTIKIWSSKTFKYLKTLVGHEGRISGLAIDDENNYIYSSSYDLTWKKWNNENI